MEKIFFITVIIVAVAVVLLSVGVIIRGRFVNSHVSSNRYLRKKGIHCARQQDREARAANPHAVSEREKH